MFIVSSIHYEIMQPTNQNILILILIINMPALTPTTNTYVKIQVWVGIWIEA